MEIQKIEMWLQQANEIADKVHGILIESFNGDDKVIYCVEVSRWQDYVKVMVFISINTNYSDLREVVDSRCTQLVYSDYYREHDDDEFMEKARKMIVDFAEEVEAATNQPNY